MLERQIQALGTVMKSPEFHSRALDGALSLMKLVLFKDYGAGVDLAKASAELLFHTPTILYWDKMWRYMCGVYKIPEDHLKLAEKFYDDNPRYEAFVKKQMNLINQYTDDLKIDYFACLTRCYIYSGLEENLYLKLARFLNECTPGELQFLAETSYDARLDNTMMAASLYQYGLLMLETQANGKSKYVLSDFGKALKQNSLNFDDGIQGQVRLGSYNQLTPANLPSLATDEDIMKLFQ